MENSQRNSQVLLNRAGTSVTQLLQRFENIIALAPISSTSSSSRNTTAVDAYQIQVETAALIRAAQEITSLTRSLKEMWLFGQLDTIGTNKEVEERTERAARGVAQGLERVVAKRERGVGNGDGASL